jgi:hypothetical protein
MYVIKTEFKFERKRVEKVQYGHTFYNGDEEEPISILQVSNKVQKNWNAVEISKIGRLST